jgi:hypothetical protein
VALIIGGSTPGQTPPQWLLAVNMTPDGKGIICDDTQTGGLVELAYDPATKTIGGITGVFDAKTKGFVALADAGNDIPANDLTMRTVSVVPSAILMVCAHHVARARCRSAGRIPGNGQPSGFALRLELGKRD